MKMPLNKQKCWLRVTTDFRRAAAENCALQGHYAASSGKFLTDVSVQPIGPSLIDP